MRNYSGRSKFDWGQAMQALPLKTGVEEGQALTGSLEELIEAFKAFKVKFPISTYFPVLLSSRMFETFRAV